jgi:tRNA-uridine 2-sulfurtransferase
MAGPDLGCAPLPPGARIVVGMSGGVDSAVTAALFSEAGYEVVGITLQLYDQGRAAGKPGACCAGQDISDAARVAAQLGIPHYVLDYEARFRDAVIDDFADTYARGETPVPCIRCNQSVKFTDLLEVARDLGAAALATGHYARRLDGRDGPELHRALDPARDQSYFLFATTRAQLDFLRFPLGGMTKAETRAAASRLGLGIADKPDSQDLCFVPSGSYARLVEKLKPGALTAGDIVDLEGRVLGRHDGIINFTVGQRRGLDLGGAAEKLFVLRLEPETARVVVGPRAALAEAGTRLSQMNWLDPSAATSVSRPVMVKLRSTQKPQPARLTAARDATGDETALIEFDAPLVTGVAPGQAGVVYDGDRVIAGGWIRRDPRSRVAAGLDSVGAFPDNPGSLAAG